MYIETVILFIFGTIGGSFLNALAFRHNTGKSMWGRSACTTCGRTLAASDLFPVLSFIFLRGRCRGCKSKISYQYPTVEVLAGLIAVFSYEATGDGATFVLSFGFFMLLLFIAVYDLRHTIIPDQFVYTAAAVALLTHSYTTGTGFMFPDPQFLLAGPLLSLPMALIWFFSKGRAMGLGDAKLMCAIGFFLGADLGLASFVISFWLGAIVGVLLLLISRYVKKGGRVTMKSEVPFGPFLALSAALVYSFHVSFTSIILFF